MIKKAITQVCATGQTTFFTTQGWWFCHRIAEVNLTPTINPIEGKQVKTGELWKEVRELKKDLIMCWLCVNLCKINYYLILHLIASSLNFCLKSRHQLIKNRKNKLIVIEPQSQLLLVGSTRDLFMWRTSGLDWAPLTHQSCGVTGPSSSQLRFLLEN